MKGKEEVRSESPYGVGPAPQCVARHGGPADSLSNACSCPRDASHNPTSGDPEYPVRESEKLTLPLSRTSSDRAACRSGKPCFLQSGSRLRELAALLL